MMRPYLASLHIYPVKSCHRVDLDAAELEPWGLAGDRRRLITDLEGQQRTQRVLPRMALIQPSYGEDGRLRLRAPEMGPETSRSPRRSAARALRRRSSRCGGSPGRPREPDVSRTSG